MKNMISKTSRQQIHEMVIAKKQSKPNLVKWNLIFQEIDKANLNPR